ncbi:MAG: hypothetical protein WKF74_07485 [Pyrinomonadaceae bacterium]
MKKHLLSLPVGIVTLAFGIALLYVSERHPKSFANESQPPVTEYQIGRLEAERDLQQDKRIYRRCERNCVWVELTDDFERIMLKDYGVEVLPIDSCGVRGASRERTDGYNRVQVDNLEKIYGERVIDKAQRLAHEKYNCEILSLGCVQ